MQVVPPVHSVSSRASSSGSRFFAACAGKRRRLYSASEVPCDCCDDARLSSILTVCAAASPTMVLGGLRSSRTVTRTSTTAPFSTRTRTDITRSSLLSGSSTSAEGHAATISILHFRIGKRFLHVEPAPLMHQTLTTELSLPQSAREIAKTERLRELKTAAERDRARRRLHGCIWRAMAALDWNRWHSLFQEFKLLKLAYDEVTYMLLLWGHVLSHRHRSENALLVLEAMRSSSFIHGGLLRATEGMLHSYMELAELDARPEPSSWQNVVRMLLHSAQRYQRKRLQRTKRELLAMPPDAVLALTPNDVRATLLDDVRKSQFRFGISDDAAVAQDLQLHEDADNHKAVGDKDNMNNCRRREDGHFLPESISSTSAQPGYGDIARMADEELQEYCGDYARGDYLRALEVEEALDEELTETLFQEDSAADEKTRIFDGKTSY
ncbi:unnamed protein product [Amoebophrya sp. A25]|nr:unnamed protein product [Amoebophrya sp. A25]|eukprot:GSA25T00019578001.1